MASASPPPTRGIHATSRRHLVAVALLTVLATTALLVANEARGDEPRPFVVGDELPALRLEDQHGEAHTLTEDVAIVLFSRDMDGGDVIKAALADDGAALLERSAAVYVADISGMPGLVSRLFALPAMRRRPYRMWLDRDGEATARMPGVEGKATLLRLAERRITAIEQLDSSATLRSLLTARSAGR